MDRRNHRTPFTAQGLFLRSVDGRPVAACETEGLARYIRTACNSFDALCEALDLCRGALQLDDSFESHPGYQRLLKLREQIERELRG